MAHQQVIPAGSSVSPGLNMNGWPINQLAQLPGRNRIVLAVRGYGASRLLPHIDWQGLVARQQRDPLLICGHSDFTAIQSGLLAMGNVITFSGPMLAGNFGAETSTRLPSTISGRRYASRNSPSNGRAKGRTAGWKAPCGKSGDADLAYRHAVAAGGPRRHPVVEDINEHPFRVERMLLQLLHSGVLAAQKAVIFGSFTGSAPNDYDAGYDLPQVFDYLRQQLSLPLISGLEFGHEQRTVTLPLGARAR